MILLGDGNGGYSVELGGFGEGYYSCIGVNGISGGVDQGLSKSDDVEQED